MKPQNNDTGEDRTLFTDGGRQKLGGIFEALESWWHALDEGEIDAMRRVFEGGGEEEVEERFPGAWRGR